MIVHHISNMIFVDVLESNNFKVDVVNRFESLDVVFAFATAWFINCH